MTRKTRAFRPTVDDPSLESRRLLSTTQVPAPIEVLAARSRPTRVQPITGSISGRLVFTDADTVSVSGQSSRPLTTLGTTRMTGVINGANKAGRQTPLTGEVTLTSNQGTLRLRLTGTQPASGRSGQVRLTIIEATGRFAGMTGGGTGTIQLGRIRNDAGPLTVSLNLLARRPA